MWVLLLCGSGGSQGQTGERAAAKQLNSLRHSIPDHPNSYLIIIIIIMYLFDKNTKTISTTTSTCKTIKLADEDGYSVLIFLESLRLNSDFEVDAEPRS